MGCNKQNKTQDLAVQVSVVYCYVVFDYLLYCAHWEIAFRCVH